MTIGVSRPNVLKAAVAAGGLMLAATIVVGTEREARDGPAQPVAGARVSVESASAGPAPQVKPGAPDLDLARLNRPGTTEIEDDLFALRTPPVIAPPAPPAAPPPPPKPAGPPLPFKFLGRMTDGGILTVFVAQGNQNLSLRKGDVVDNLYRVEEVSDASVIFVYLPLDERQALQIGGMN
ncbi:MAG: hypothetical protein HYS20_05565 [Rhodocyclales bacterium]|nr:hypothetical protein [Rhodocyclales bacterium]